MNCYDDDVETVVYLVNKSTNNVKDMFVMKRSEAIKFCSDKRTKGNGWLFMFTTRKTNWRNELKSFGKDDGRFEELFKELNITPIYHLK